MFEDIQSLLSFLSILLFSATDSLHLLQIPAKNYVFPWVAEGTIHFDPRVPQPPAQAARIPDPSQAHHHVRQDPTHERQCEGVDHVK